MPTAANLNLHRGRNSWHCDDEPLFGRCVEAKHTVFGELWSFCIMEVEHTVLCRLLAGAVLVMVTFLSWMANVRRLPSLYGCKSGTGAD